MIFVSSSCVKNKLIKDSVLELVDIGFKNIELSGGTELYEDLESDLLEIKNKFKLNYRCHNYFPPPPKHFVLNLASLDEEVFNMSKEHVKRALALSEQLGCEKYGVHAGFLINISTAEIGKSIQKKDLFDRRKALESFIKAIGDLSRNSQVKLYIENNVISAQNFKNYEEINPLLLTCHKDFLELKERLKFNLLLDVAHLKVSCKSLGLNLEGELGAMLRESDYIHLSDNDGTKDSNDSFDRGQIFDILSENRNLLKGKDFTLEVYSGKEQIIKSYENLESLVC